MGEQSIFSRMENSSLLLKALVDRANRCLLFRGEKWKPLVAAHRGGPGANTVENTLSAFESNIDQCDIFETDVHMTKDRHIVISHDACLTRAHNIEKKIKECESCDLPIHDPKADKKEKCTKLVKLEDFLDNYPEKMKFIDIKDHNCEVAEKVIQIVKDKKAVNSVAIGSFNNKIEKICEEKINLAPTFVSQMGVALFLLRVYTGLIFFTNYYKQKIIILPDPEHSTPELKNRYKFMVTIYKILLCNPFMRAVIRYKQLYIGMFTVNRYEQVKRAKHIGASILVTDYPKRINDFLDAINHEGKFKDD